MALGTELESASPTYTAGVLPSYNNYPRNKIAFLRISHDWGSCAFIRFLVVLASRLSHKARHRAFLQLLTTSIAKKTRIELIHWIVLPSVLDHYTILLLIAFN